MQTFLRRLEILNFLHGQHVPVATETILQHLLDAGYLDQDDRMLRSQYRLIQRDLKFLLGPEEDGEHLNDFGLQTERGLGKSQLWRLDPYQQLQYDLERMPAYMALALSISAKHLTQVLPRSTQKELSRLFERADRRLNQQDKRLSANHYHRLTRAVEFYQRGQSLRPPDFNMAHLDAIYQAILKGRRLRIRYHASGQLKDYDLHPYGVTILLPKLYLIAKKHQDSDRDDGETFRSFLIHRIETVEISRFANHVPDDFAMKDYLEQGRMDVYIDTDDRQPYQLELEIADSPGLLIDLQESPIAQNQSLNQQGNGRWLLTAEVQRTVQLRNWLLSLGPNAKVVAPDIIRLDLQQHLRATLEQYPE